MSSRATTSRIFVLGFLATLTSPITGSDAWNETLCPKYSQYSTIPSKDLSDGARHLPRMRPKPQCRTFNSTKLENVLQEITPKFKDPDLAVLFENALTQTLDTTVRWYDPIQPFTFVITGDIPAEWLRDVSCQMNVYMPLIKEDLELRRLILGVINLQAYYVSKEPFCSVFSAPSQSGLPYQINNGDRGHITNPSFDPTISFICQLEIDGLGGFIFMSLRYWRQAGDSSFVTPTWITAIERMLSVFEGEMRSTFNAGGFIENTFNFTSPTNPVKNLGVGAPQLYTGMIGTSMRPSDDRVAWHFNIPDNAMIAVQTGQLSGFLQEVVRRTDLARRAKRISRTIRKGIETHGVVQHPVWGRVYAYEVDGYGSANLMDDANVPSLLSMPYLGYAEFDSPVYKATRKMLLSTRGNPYYVHGRLAKGITSPHLRVHDPDTIWPMSLATLILSSENDTEISEALELILGTTADLGLVHESVDVNKEYLYSRQWFGWTNSYVSEAILYIAEKKPHLIFKDNVPAYLISPSGSLADYGLMGKAYASRSIIDQLREVDSDSSLGYIYLGGFILICLVLQRLLSHNDSNLRRRVIEDEEALLYKGIQTQRPPTTGRSESFASQASSHFGLPLLKKNRCPHLCK